MPCADNTLYEKPADLVEGAVADKPTDAASCGATLAGIAQDVNDACCPHGGCRNGIPNDCSDDCSAVWMPFARECTEWIAGQSSGSVATLAQITGRCEEQEYGTYTPGAPEHEGRCTDADMREYNEQFAPACCGGNMEYCAGLQPGQSPIEAQIAPTLNGQAYCHAGCRAFVERF
eukprot:SAG11_NODE_7470_length_1139_cov_1.010577_1_plen_174_part_10